MILFMVMFISTNAFYDAHFSSLPARATGFFSNPAGLGRQPGSEILFVYEEDYLLGAALLGYGGMGVIKADTTYRYEAGIGYRLPGAFSFGYAYQFGDTSLHVVGVIGALSPRLTVGYKTTWGERKHMFYGISLTPFERYLTLVGDIEYEGIGDILNYYYGAVLQPQGGLGLSFSADQDFNWRAGLMVSLGYLKIAGLYIDESSQFSVGVLVSAQSYESIIPEAKEETYLDF
jgi:hypothetical protein